jgi:hypothetical protein
MATTPSHPTRRHTSIALVGLVSVVIVTAGCGTGLGATNLDRPTTTVGYSYYHDSRINETPTGTYRSTDHDSRINETP